MKERLKKLLLLLGVSAEHAEKMLADEEPQDLTADQVKAAAVDKLKKVLETDRTFTDPIHKATQGKLLDMWTKKLRKSFPGITDEEVEALPAENNFEALLALAATKATAKAGEDGDKDKEITKLNGSLREIKAELKKLREEELPAAQKQGERERENVLVERLAERTLTKGDGLVVDPEFAVPSVLAKLRERFDLKHEAGGIKLLKKGENVPAFDAENNELTFEGELKNIGTAAKLFKVSNGGAGGGTGGAGGAGGGSGEGGAGGGGEDGKRNLPPGLAKARKHAEELKKRQAEKAE